MRYYAKLKSSIRPKLGYSHFADFKVKNQRNRKVISQGSVGKAGRTRREYVWELWITVLGDHLKFESVFMDNYEFIELFRILPKGAKLQIFS